MSKKKRLEAAQELAKMQLEHVQELLQQERSLSEPSEAVTVAMELARDALAICCKIKRE